MQPRAGQPTWRVNVARALELKHQGKNETESVQRTKTTSPMYGHPFYPPPRPLEDSSEPPDDRMGPP